MTAVSDLRFAIRLLLKSPRYVAAAVIVLALATGANTAVFSVVHGVLLTPLPVRDAERLVVVWDTDPSRNLPVVELPYRTFQHWAGHSRSFASLSVIGSSTWPAIMQGRSAPVRLAATGVSATFFDTLGAVPLLGRTLRAEDDVPHAAAVAVLSHATWAQHFGSDPGVIGSRVQLGTTRTIVGVMPPEFDFPRGTGFWFPVVPLLSEISRPDFDAFAKVGVLFAVGRLKDGIAPGAAAQELDRLTPAGGSAAPPRFGSALAATPFLEYVLGPVRQGLWALWVAVGLLMLIACANVSGLMLTRASIRSREHAVRVALGGTRMDVARLWLTESALLGVAGGVFGLAAAWWMTKAIVVLAPAAVPRIAAVTISPLAALFAVLLVVTAVGLCGGIPARHAGGGDLIERLNDSVYATPGRRKQRARSALLIVQIALSVVLLVGAGLVVRSFDTLRRLDVGFVPADVVTMYVGALSNQQMHELLERVATLPRVQAAGAVHLRPLELGPIGYETSARLEGQDEKAAERNPTLNFQVATPGFFPATRVRLVRGRLFSDHDRAAAEPVVVVGETAARRLWPGDDPLGKRMLLRQQKEWRRVVGVVADVHYRGLGDVRLDVYEPALQSESSVDYLTIRASGDPLALVSAIQREVRRLDAGAVVDSIATLEGIVARAVAPWRFTAWLLAVLGAVAFVLTTVGLFGVVSLDVTERRYELAIRLALGAPRRDLLASVLVPAAQRSMAGIVAGVAVAASLSGLLTGLLFRVQPLDPLAWVGVLSIVLGVVCLAAYMPARRAATMDPLMLIRR